MNELLAAETLSCPPAELPSGGTRVHRRPRPALSILAVLSLVMSFLGLVVAGAQRAGASGLTTWTQLSPATTPPARSGASMAYDPLSEETFLFGGDNGGALDDTWSWNGSSWSRLSPATSPPARYDASMAYDEDLDEMILFGGYGSGGEVYDDTWAFNGTSWNELSPVTSPPARYAASLSYDASSSQLVLFGGHGSGGELGDTWVLTGQSWRELSPATSPTARENASLAYDSTSSELVLFGGLGAGGDLADTWGWSGSDWSQLSSAASPSAREESVISDDPSAGGLILFGGYFSDVSETAELSDTWEWDGTGWTELVPGTSPAARFGAAMAYDPEAAQLVLFGGNCVSGDLDDTWVAGSTSVTSVSPSAGPTAGGTTVTVLGSGFQSVSGVDFGSEPASFRVVSGSELTATAPAGAVGTVDVTVTDAFGTSATSASDQFTYAAPPTLTALSPVAGPLGGGSTVTITGTNLAGASSVDFGSTAASSFVVTSASSITAVSPPGPGGTLEVKVTTPGGTSPTGASDDFTYEAAPSVSSLSPSDGPPAGGTTVVVSGTGFVGASALYFGTTEATSFSVSSPSSITAVSPAGSTGSVDVLVTTPVGTSTAESGDEFTYSPPPGAPTGVTAVAGDASAVVSWEDPASIGIAPSSYTVTATDATDPADGGQTCTAYGANATSCSLGSLVNGDAYSFVVTASNAIGEGPGSSPSDTVVPMTVPGAPLDPSATASSLGPSATVSWKPPGSDGGSGITGYVVEASGGEGQTCRTTGATSCVVEELGYATSYSFSVTASNAAGTGPAAVSGAVTTPRAPALVRATYMSLRLSRSRAAFGHENTVRVTVIVKTHKLGTPTGTVVVKFAGRVLGTIGLRHDIGSCRLSAGALSRGVHRLTASYQGRGVFLGSGASAELTVTA